METDSYLTQPEVTQVAGLLYLLNDEETQEVLNSLSMEISLIDCNGEPAGVITRKIGGQAVYYPNGGSDDV